MSHVSVKQHVIKSGNETYRGFRADYNGLTLIFCVDVIDPSIVVLPGGKRVLTKMFKGGHYNSFIKRNYFERMSMYKLS